MHATTAWASSSYRTCSITVCSTPSSRFHTLADRTPFHPPWDRPLSSRNHRRGAACSHGRTGQPTHGSVTRAENEGTPRTYKHPSIVAPPRYDTNLTGNLHLAA